MNDAPLRLEFAPKARRDLIARIEYLNEHASLSVAEHFIRSLAGSMDLLRTTPAMGKIFRIPSRGPAEFRWVAVSQPFQNWLVIYTVDDFKVRIERLTHSAQDIRRFLL
jgi:plasmid stabilization system protein ParE